MRTEARDIAHMLAQRAEDLCAVLLPSGKRDGGEWRVGSLMGEPGQSLSIRITGARAGVWKEFNGTAAGDALDLVAAVNCNGDIGAAIRWAKGWLGILDFDDESYRKRREEAAASAEKMRGEDVERQKAKLFIAKRIWLDAGAEILNTPIATYLAGRAIDLTKLPKLPRALRYASACYCAENKRRMPAMIASINDADGQLVAAHRTYLQLHADGTVTKAKSLAKSKAVLGSYAGAFIALNRGASGKPIKDAPEGDTVVIAEGIEDGLSIAIATPHYRVIAAISISNIKNLQLPAAIRNVIIATDNDYCNPAAQRALDAAVLAFTNQGRDVRIARSRVGKDFNDQLMAG